MTTTTPTRCAIYARKSPQQHASEEDRSVVLQVANARAFAESKGWTILDDQVYVDDGISGAASLARLRAKSQLLDAIQSGPPFQMLIVQAADRLSRRDGHEALTELAAIDKGGVQIWFYSDGTKFEYGTFQDNVLGFMRAKFSAEFRRSVASKTAEAMKRKAARGHVTGGRVFGYDNVARDGHVDRVINAAEATVVRHIFDLCGLGTGYTRIAKLLDAHGDRCPRPQQDRPAGWSPSTVRDVLYRELYRGVVVWNRTKKRARDGSGDIAPTARPETEWLRTTREDLRLVSEAVWQAAHARLARTRVTLATAIGHRRLVQRDYDSKCLLTGFARCAQCGGAITTVSREHGKRRVYFYGCLTNWKRGAAICRNDLILPLERVDDAVLQALGGDTLRPAVVSAILDAVLAQLVPAHVETRVDALRQQLRVVETKIAHLSAAIEQGGSFPPSLRS